jgi:hypothetical protein
MTNVLGHFISLITRIREAHPKAIPFINPPIFSEPPRIAEDVKQGRIALSTHFYDGLTMLGKRETWPAILDTRIS